MNRSAYAPLQRRLLSLMSSVLLIVGLTAFFSSPAQAANTGSISGKVTALAGGGNLEGITALLYTLNTDDPDDPYWDTDFEFSDDTAADGTYTIAGVPAGSYRIGFLDFAGDHLDGYYGAGGTVETVDSGTSVVVGTGAVVGKNAVLKGAGHIAGHVQNASGDPIADAFVDVYVPIVEDTETYWESFWYGSTDQDGNYDVGGLAPGTDYRIGFSSDTYIGEYWNGKATVEDADNITVIAGTTTAGKDASLVEGGHVTGTVTGPGATALDGADVTAYHLVTDGGDSYWDSFAYASTDSSGNFDLGGLPDGTVRIGYDYYDYDNDIEYLSEYWDNKATVEEAGDIVISGAGTVPGKNAQLSKGAQIKGKVTKTGGTAVEGVDVIAYQEITNDGPAYWDEMQYTESDSSGNYTLSGLVAGTYRLAFGEESGTYIPQYWNNQPTFETAGDIVVATDAVVTGKNATLAVGGKITGKVTKSGTTTALQDIEVDVFKKVGTEWEAIGYGNTLANGTYAIGGLRSGTYRVGFFDYDGTYATRYYDNDATVETAKDVVVTAPNTTSAINVGLVLGGKITGTVTPAAGSSAEGADHIVEVYPVGSNQVAGYGFVDPDASNTYSITGLAAGSYRVEFGRSSGESISAGEYYNDKPDGAAGKAAANAVVVGAGGTTPNINATLAKGGDISGKVVDGNGDPLGDCVVSASASDGSLAARSGVTAGIGLFDVTGLATGDYQLAVDCDGLPVRYYTGTSGVMSTDIGAVATVHVTVSATTSLANNLVDADPATIANVKLPTITPTTVPMVGNTLTASRGSWIAPVATVYTYQWLRDGAPIPSATASTYKPVAADVGTKLSVKVTGTKSPLTPATATSAETAAVIAIPPNVTTTGTISVDASGNSKINVACVKACVGWLQVRTAADSTSAADTSVAIQYSVAAKSYKSYALTSVPLDVNPTAKVRIAQTSPVIGANPQFNDLKIVRAAGNTLKTSAKVTVDPYGKATVNVSCTKACSGYAQVWNDGTDAGSKSSVFHYTLTKAGYMAMPLTGVAYANTTAAKVRLAVSTPKAFPGDSPQLNALELVKGAANVVKTSTSTKVSAAGKATVNISCTMACEGYVQLWSDEGGAQKSANTVHYKLTKAGYLPMYFTGVPHIDSATWKTRVAAKQPASGASTFFNALTLIAN